MQIEMIMEKHMTETSGPRVLDAYDATTLVGLRTIVYNAAIERTESDGEISVEVPKLRELLAAAAMARCLTPIRLQGYEIRAIRKIMGLTLAELGELLGESTPAATVSRWESEQRMGGFAEKCLRLAVCERLKDAAPGMSYDAAKLSPMKVSDPWLGNPDYVAPAVEITRVRVKKDHGAAFEAWDLAA
jgi:DNA-binding transcriptional regulator YiaG